jgi:hypothetical protein
LSYDNYVEVSEKEIANVTVERFAVGGVAKGDFILVKLAGKRIISYFIAEVMILVDMNVKSGIKNGWRTPINISLTKKKNISAFFVVALWKLPTPIPAGMSKCQASQLCFSVDFYAFSTSLAIQNV